MARERPSVLPLLAEAIQRLTQASQQDACCNAIMSNADSEWIAGQVKIEFTSGSASGPLAGRLQSCSSCRHRAASLRPALPELQGLLAVGDYLPSHICSPGSHERTGACPTGGGPKGKALSAPKPAGKRKPQNRRHAKKSSEPPQRATRLIQVPNSEPADFPVNGAPTFTPIGGQAYDITV